MSKSLELRSLSNVDRPRNCPKPRVKKLAWSLAGLTSVALHIVVLSAMCSWPGPCPESAASKISFENTVSFGQNEFVLSPEEQDGFGTLVVAGSNDLELTAAKAAPIGPAGEASATSAPVADAPGSPGAGSGQAGAGQGMFFGIPAQGRRIVYVLDASASMGRDGAWSIASAELAKSLRNLPSGTAFRILVYNSTPQDLLPGRATWLTASDDVLVHVERALAALPIEGRTDHLPALRQALYCDPDVVFFLTDADELKPEDVRKIQAWNRTRAVIHTVELSLAHRSRDDMPMQLLARSTGGHYRAVAR